MRACGVASEPDYKLASARLFVKRSESRRVHAEDLSGVGGMRLASAVHWAAWVARKP
jgi:hypothetical protein